MTNRKALLAKVRALLAKTVENGCTEAEAMAALAKARELMDEYDLTDTDLAFGGEEVKAEERNVADRHRIRDYLATAVGTFCQCKAWSGMTYEHVTFCGLDSDTVFAHWLLDTLADFVDRALQDYLRSTWRPGMPSVRRTETNGFVIGCCSRIVQRLRELAPRPPRTSTGRDLVVARNALIERKLNELGLRLRRVRGGSKRTNNDAFAAGRRKGDAAQFNRPINEGGPVQRIGDETW